MISRMVPRKARAYKNTFNGVEGRRVLADLRNFCHATKPTANVDNVNATFVAEGRREVWLRIQTLLKLDEDEIYQLIEEYDNE